jgi:hypothetical protein
VIGNNVTRVGQRGVSLVENISDAHSRSYSSGGVDRPIGYDKKMVNFWFHRPLRVYRNRRITIQLVGLDNTFSYQPLHKLTVSILYTELPNPRNSYRT